MCLGELIYFYKKIKIFKIYIYICIKFMHLNYWNVFYYCLDIACINKII